MRLSSHFCIFLLLASSACAYPQSKTSPTSIRPFDVISIRQVTEPLPGWNIQYPPVAGQFTAKNITLAALLTYAYQQYHIRATELVNAPDWIYNDRFDIAAKSDPVEVSKDSATMAPAKIDEDNCIRLQSLLRDRFGLKAHLEQKNVKVLVLTASKRPKLTTSTTTNDATTSGYGVMSATGVTASSLAASLSDYLDERVINETGLGGYYDFTLKWAPDNEDASESGPSLFTAVSEQLGLELHPATRMADVLVIDRITKPTPN